MSETARVQAETQALLTEMRHVAGAEGFEAAIKHFTVVAATEPGGKTSPFQVAAMRALQTFLADPNEHLFHCLWADVDFDLPGSAR